MLVEEAMSTDLVTCEVDASLRDAVGEMLRNRVGSTIVREGGQPTGIVTETDVLHAGYVTDTPFSEIPVRDVMSSSLVTISKEKTLRRATEQMRDEGVKKLVVVEDMDLVGIVTSQDVVRNYGAIKSELRSVLEMRDGFDV